MKNMTYKQIKEIITISDGNIKLGVIPSLSLPPVKTCRSDAPCTKDCYAMKAWRLRPSVRMAYNKNLDSFLTRPYEFKWALHWWLAKRKPNYFRFNVSGDIPNAKYRDLIIDTAKQYKNIKFLVFTKKYHLFSRTDLDIPENLSVIFSAWPGFDMPKTSYPIAFMDDGNETRLDGTEVECPGNCESCGMCWSLKKINKNVVFKKH